MKMKGDYLIPAPRDRVWAALNDVEVLKASIPGCESLDRDGDNRFKATALAKVGPVKARFSGIVTLSELNPPISYRISGEGQGGAAGFAKGGAEVHLEEEEAGKTRLAYEVDATVGGKLAQVGQRLIDTVAKKMADEFFVKFTEMVAGPGETAGEQTDVPDSIAPETPGRGWRRWRLQIATLVILVLAVLLYFAFKN